MCSYLIVVVFYVDGEEKINLLGVFGFAFSL